VDILIKNINEYVNTKIELGNKIADFMNETVYNIFLKKLWKYIGKN
jgi:hypothetical protein